MSSEPPQQDFDPDSEQAETVLYPCGTVAIGQFEPCAHSSVQVLCCSCAGCSADVWSCGRQRPEPRWEQYEDHLVTKVFSTNVVLWMFAFVILVLTCSEIPHWIILVAWATVGAVATLIVLGASVVVHAAGSVLGL